MNLDKRLLQQLRAARVFLVLTIILGFGVGVLTIVQARALSQIIAQVFLQHATLDGVWGLLLGLLALIAARAAFAWGSEVAAFRIAARVKTDLRERVFDHLLALGPTYARGERTGELTNTLVEGIEALEAYFSQYLPQLVLAALVPFSVLAFVFPLDLLSGFVLLLTGPLIPIFMLLIGSAADALTRRQWQSLSRLSAHFLDVLQGLTTLKIFGRSREQIETIARISHRFRDTTLGVLRVAFLSAFALETIATISTAIVAVEVGLRLLYGQLEFEQAFFVLVLAPDFYLPLRLLGTRFHAGMSGAAAAQRVFEILETPTHRAECRVTSDVIRGTRHPSLVTFHDVHYTYAGDRPALHGVSFEIAPGQRTALVGPTGAGKSTVVSLLLRFIQAERGEITCDGVPLCEWLPQEWRAQIAWVPQMPYLFNESVAANIRLARPDAPMEDVIRAAELAHADEFIRALPQGYETMIGERGARLSAGQAQRLALARAFLKDAPFLILDEATSNLDVENETLIQDAIERLLGNKTALIISHRLNTVTRADQIIVLQDGSVAETGTHVSLMQQRGVYRRLVVASGAWRVTRHSGQQWSSPSTPLRSAQDAKEQRSRRAGEQGSRFNPVVGSRQSQIENRATRHSSLITFYALLRLAAPFKWWIALAILLGACTIGSSIGLMATAAYIIASAARHPSIADLAVPIVGVRFFGIARGAFRYLERYVSHYVNFSLLARLRVWFYKAIEPLAPAQLMQSAHRSGDLLSRIVGDIETLQNFYVRILAPPLVALVIAGAMFVFLSGYSSMLALIVLIFMCLVGVVVPLIVLRVSQRTNQQTVQLRSELNAQLVDGIQGIADLIAFGREQAQAERIRTLSRELVRQQTRMASLTGLHNAAGNWLTHLAMWSALAIAIPMVTSARLEGVYLPVIALAVLTSFEGVLALPLAFQYLESNLQSARRLFEIFDFRFSIFDFPFTGGAPVTRGKPKESAIGNRQSKISVDDLSFRYAPGEPLALDRVSFDLRAGTSLAIVGPSGAGKSTLVNLLLRLWDYETGTIVVGERDLRAYAPDAARALFAVVSQPTHLFNATIRENLLLARPAATDAEMIVAARQAQCHAFIASLPRGYDTLIGEQGLRLSGGERQRLAIARALLKHAPILVLDEPTANLDPATERHVLSAIQQLVPDRTTLIITHRLVGLEDADEILVLHAGRVIERGTHAELLQLNGYYWRMWELQNALIFR